MTKSQKHKVTPPRRRYKIGRHPDYDTRYDRLLMESVFLNPDVRSQNLYWAMLDTENRRQVERALEEVKNRISQTLQAINRQKKHIEASTGRRRREGEPDPQPYSNEMESLHALEAAYDVALVERDEVSKWLTTAKDTNKEARRTRILYHGPQGKRDIRNGHLHAIDGQLIGQADDGKYFIDDDLSPYNGMRLEDYQRLATQWITQRQKRMAQRQREIREARKQGRHVEQRGKGLSWSNRIKRQNLPEWPEWAKSIKQEV